MRASAQRIVAALTLTAGLSACTGDGGRTPEVTVDRQRGVLSDRIDDGGTGLVGPAGGVALGALVGSGGGAKAALIAGVAVGYIAGGTSGPTLTGLAASAQRRAVAHAMSAPVGTGVSWFHPQDQARGAITPTREFTDDKGRRCRTFIETRSVRAMKGRLTGIACLPA